MPDTKQILSINKKLCREVLSEYQTQSRDLQHNHIDEALFDDIIQEIGLKIVAKIDDRQAFTIAFEQYVIDVQQAADLKYQVPPHSAVLKRPQSATCRKTKDLIHAGNIVRNLKKNIIRPQSALPVGAKTFCSEKLSNLGIGTEEVDVMTVHSDGDNDEDKMKYCLDGIIAEM